MSYVKLERRPKWWWRQTASSIGEMIDKGWTVFSVCNRSTSDIERACHLVSQVDLAVMEFLLSDTAELWNYHPACRRFGCKGHVTFYGAPPELDAAMDLRAEWPPDWRDARPPRPKRISPEGRRRPARWVKPPSI